MAVLQYGKLCLRDISLQSFDKKLCFASSLLIVTVIHQSQKEFRHC